MSYGYDRSSLNTKTTYGNGVTSTTTYDDAKRVKTVSHNRGTRNLSRTEYEYDVNGNRKKETINRTGGAQVTTYDYDTADRMTVTDVTEAGKKVTSIYDYDAVANRKIETVTTAVGGVTDKVSKEYTYDGRNQLRKIVDSKKGVTDLDYDGQGNLTQKTVGNDLTKYTYNARDNLMGVSRNSTILGRYFSDHRGLRVEKEAKDRLYPNAAPVRLRTLWDGRNAFQDSTIGGVVTMRYENDGRHPVSMWSKDDGVQALHRDALGSIVATTDTAGELKSETLFDAWGNVQVQTGQSANKFGYTGHQMDHETGLIYFQARYYDPEIGRFITQDPFEGDWKTPLSLHHYLYAYGNPTTYVDLHGYSSTPCFGDRGACGASPVEGYNEAAANRERAALTRQLNKGYRATTSAQRDKKDFAEQRKADEAAKANRQFTAEPGNRPGVGGKNTPEEDVDIESVLRDRARVANAAAKVGSGASKAADIIAENCFPTCGKMEGAMIGFGVAQVVKKGGKLIPLAKKLLPEKKAANALKPNAANRSVGPGRSSTGDRVIDEANLVAAPGGEIGAYQRNVLKGNLPEVQRRSPQQNRVARKEFERDQAYLKQQWEEKTGTAWPTQENAAGNVVPATPHHIIPLESGGANKWWNLMPTFGRLPNHSLPGIKGPHAEGGVLRNTIQRGPKALPAGTVTDLRKDIW
jgi:RHS repeat-associated protein